MKRLIVMAMLLTLVSSSCAAQRGHWKPTTRQYRSPQGFVQVSLGGVEQTVVAGSRNIRLTWLNFSNHYDWGQDITSIRLRVETDGDVVNWLHDFSLYTDDGRQLRTTNDPDADIAAGVDREYGWVQFDLDPDGIPQFIDSDGKLSLYVTFGVSPGINDNTSIKAVLHLRQITFKPVDRRPARITPARRLVGPVVTVLEKGHLSISKKVDTPNHSLLPGSTNGITAMRLNLLAIHENIWLETLPVYFGKLNDGGPDQVRLLSIYRDAELIIQNEPTMMDNVSDAVFDYLRRTGRDDIIARIEAGYIPTNASGGIDLGSRSIFLPQDEVVTLTIKVDTSDSNQRLGSIGESGQGFNLYIPGEEIIAKGELSGRTVEVVDEASSSDFHLFRSVPYVATNDLLSSGGVPGGTIAAGIEQIKPLYAFGITADSSGDLGLGRLSFAVRADNVGLGNLQVIDQLGQVIGEGFVAENPDGEFILDDDTVVVVDFFEPYTVPAGTTKVLTLVADIECTQANGCASSNSEGSVLSVQLLGDPAFPELLPGTYNEVAGQSWFIWTDFTWTPVLQIAHEDVLTMPQWTNGYRVMTFIGNTLPPRSTPVTFLR